MHREKCELLLVVGVVAVVGVVDEQLVKAVGPMLIWPRR
jgi:hypothetical protein